MPSVRLIYRLILLALLPCIAVILYLSGQHYDPSLIDFKAPSEKSSISAQTVEKAFSAPEAKDIAGFRQFGRARHFTKDNLYEHVDGHAEYFISAGFGGLTVTGYRAAGSASAQAEIQAEVFDMGKSMQAFGVLTDESGEHAQEVAVGTKAFKTSSGINFFKGRYYVKISSFGQNVPVLAFARGLSETLPAGQDSFEAFSKLPAMGKVGKTRFIKEGYRGLDFLHNVIEREYSAGGKKVTVALMSDSVQEMNTLQAALLTYFSSSGMHYEKREKDGQEFYKVIDKYEGTWLLIPSRNALFGVFGTEDEAVVKYFGKSKQ